MQPRAFRIRLQQVKSNYYTVHRHAAKRCSEEVLMTTENSVAALEVRNPESGRSTSRLGVQRVEIVHQREQFAGREVIHHAVVYSIELAQ